MSRKTRRSIFKPASHSHVHKKGIPDLGSSPGSQVTPSSPSPCQTAASHKRSRRSKRLEQEKEKEKRKEKVKEKEKEKEEQMSKIAQNRNQALRIDHKGANDDNHDDGKHYYTPDPKSRAAKHPVRKVSRESPSTPRLTPRSARSTNYNNNGTNTADNKKSHQIPQSPITQLDIAASNLSNAAMMLSRAGAGMNGATRRITFERGNRGVRRVVRDLEGL